MLYDGKSPAWAGMHPGRTAMALMGANVISNLIQIIYSSRPFGFDGAMLSGILLDARRCNTRDDITGALICRNDIYLQYLEGPPAEVKAAFERIRRDNRHLEVTLRVSRGIPARLFGEWAMLHDPAKSWMWSAAEVNDDILDRATEDELSGVFENLSTNARSELTE